MKLEKGNWPAQKTKSIIASVRRVMEANDIDKLTKAAYDHIILHMGFIAHYDLAGFQSTYSDVSFFAERLLTSEYSTNLLQNRRDADRYNVDWFKKEYGAAPDYIAPNDKYFVDNLLEARKNAMNSTPTNFYGTKNYYTKETWDEVRHDFLEKTKVLTFKEYKQYIA